MRILISRTDRIGDVTISTPAIRAVREKYPDSFISVCVSKSAYPLVKNNPFIDDVIILDKKGKHKGIFGAILFIFEILFKRFDTVFVLHPSTRVHLTYFLAGIKNRIGFDTKWGGLLTKKVPHTKQKGEKHEMEYTFDVLRAAGIEPSNKKLEIYLSNSILDESELFLAKYGLLKNEKFIMLHPGSSCPSKRWPVKYFSQLSDAIAEKHNIKIVVVGDENCVSLGQYIKEHTRHKIVDLTGKTDLELLSAIIKRAILFVSNDSGPVHIAVSLGVPVISIFGRNDKGLSPKRWGPLGPNDIVFHKEVGCSVCLAHNCRMEFKCLRSIQVDEVLSGVSNLLKKIGHVS